jgi:ribosome-associated translation inhibitor RaiA
MRPLRSGGEYTMNVNVTDIAVTFGRQTRAYAEERIFRSLARFSEIVRQVDVWLTPSLKGNPVVCSVLVGLDNGMLVSVTARGRHAYDAINRVVHRIGPTLVRHTHVALPSR